MKILNLLLILTLSFAQKIIHFEDDILKDPEAKFQLDSDPACKAKSSHYAISFLNGIIKKYKPKKLLEIGVNHGCNSAIILNAIKDIKDSFLYSIDYEKSKVLNTSQIIGHFVNEKCPELKNKWKLYKGGYICEFIEEIGEDIDFVFIDTLHSFFESLDVLMFLPFLKENAIIVLNDINFHKRLSTNDKLFGYLKGKKILTKSPKEGYPNIGAVVLEANQKHFYFDYFWQFCFNWEKIPSDNDLNIIKEFFKKYYNCYYIDLFEQAIITNKNQLFGKKNAFRKFINWFKSLF